MNNFTHEIAWRGEDAVIRRFAKTPIAVCGLGLLGSLLADNLARQGAGRLILVDYDRVEPHNVSQLYRLDDVGRLKTDVMADALYATNRVEAITRDARIEDQNARKILRDAALILDCFDNAPGRLALAAYSEMAGTSCLHLGLSADGYSEVVWNEQWRRPSLSAGQTEQPPCDLPIARNLALITVALATELVWDWLEGRPAVRCQFTLKDKQVVIKSV